MFPGSPLTLPSLVRSDIQGTQLLAGGPFLPSVPMRIGRSDAPERPPPGLVPASEPYRWVVPSTSAPRSYKSLPRMLHGKSNANLVDPQDPSVFAPYLGEIPRGLPQTWVSPIAKSRP